MTQKEYKNMAETGHAKNVENWQKMIAACTGFGVDYAPSNVNLTLASMNNLLTDVETEGRCSDQYCAVEEQGCGSRKYLYRCSATHDADTRGVQGQRCCR